MTSPTEAARTADYESRDKLVAASDRKARGVALAMLCFLFFLTILVINQFATGTYTAELSGYPDEPAHFITSLMFHSYVVDWHGLWPHDYAQQFYARYPKVAIGHWPPLLYGIQAFWTLLFSPSRTASILLQSIFGSLLGLLVFQELRKRTSTAAAFTTSTLLLCSSLIQMYSTMVMAELLLATLVFAAAVQFSCLMERPTLTRGVIFGALTSAAILTKGSGWLLLLLVIAAPLLAGRPQILSSRALFLAIGIIAALTVPWQVLTMSYVVNGWEQHQFSVRYSLQAIRPVAYQTVANTGVALTALAVLGVVSGFVKECRCFSPFAASMVALIGSTVAFNVLVPTGIEGRKLITALPAAAALAGFGCHKVIELLHARSVRRYATFAVCAAVVCVFAIADWRATPPKKSYGFRQAAQYLVATLGPDAAVLVSSESDGEGLLVSEFGMLRPAPAHYIVRGSKYLASTDWTGSEYRSRVGSVKETMAALERVPICYVVLDRRTGQPRPHHRLLQQAMSGFRSVYTAPGGEVSVFQLRPSEPVKHLELDMRPMVQRRISVP